MTSSACIPSSDADPDSILREERGGVGRATSSSSSVEYGSTSRPWSAASGGKEEEGVEGREERQGGERVRQGKKGGTD